MVKIINPFYGQDPLAEMFQRLSGAYAGGKQNQYELQKAYEAQRVNAETENLMRDVAASKLGLADPQVQAEMIGAGYDPSKMAEMGVMRAATGANGWRSPEAENWGFAAGHPSSNFDSVIKENLSHADAMEKARIDAENARAANTLAEQQAADAQASMDRRYGVDQSEAGAMARQNAEPIPAMIPGPSGPPAAVGGIPIAPGAPGAPVPGFVPKGQAAGAAPILSDTQVKGGLLANMLPSATPDQKAFAAGLQPAERGVGSNWLGDDGKVYNTHDGVTDTASGRPLPPGHLISVTGSANDTGLTNTMKSQVQQGQLSHDMFNKLLDFTEQQVVNSPDQNFGIAGIVKGYAQDAAQIATGLAQGLGFTSAQDAIATVQAQATANGVSPSVLRGLFTFDPRLGALNSTYGLLVYSAAAALAGQSNRSVSDRDIIEMEKFVGNPDGIFSSKPAMLAKINALRQISQIQGGVLNSAGGGVPPAAAGAPAAAMPAPAAAPPAAPLVAPGAAPPAAPVGADVPPASFTQTFGGTPEDAARIWKYMPASDRALFQ